MNCLSPCSKENNVKKVIRKVIPLSTSEKREWISTWWDAVCQKAHQHRVTKSRNQMHKDLEKQLDLLRQDMVETRNPSPASASIGVINQTAATSVTHVNLDEDIVPTASTAYQPMKRRVSIGKAFDNFYDETKKAQGKALKMYKKNARQEELEKKKREGRQRLELQQRNFDNFVKNQQQKELEKTTSVTPYQAHLSPLDEEDTAAALENTEDSSSDESFYSIPERVPGPSPPDVTVDLDRCVLGFNDNNRPDRQQTLRRSLRSLSSSFSSSGHRTDPIIERRLPTNMGAHIEGPHALVDYSSDSSSSAASSKIENSEIQEPEQPTSNNVVPLQPTFSERMDHYSEIREDGRPIYADEFTADMVRQVRYQLARLLDIPYDPQDYARREIQLKNFRQNFAHRMKSVLGEDDMKRFQHKKDFLETYHYKDRNNIIGDGVNGVVRVVYRAADLKAKRSSSHMAQFAVKKVKVNFLNRNAILNEIHIMNQARHQINLMSFTELFYFDDTLRILMKRMTCDLYDFMVALEKPMPQKLAIHIFSKVVKGLYYLHYDLGYYHGDIKPENILLGANGQVKITDFGFSAPCGVVRTGRQGTEDYMAPEVYDETQEYNEKSDLWSLGITFISMLNCGLPELNEGNFLTADYVVIFTAFKMLFQNIKTELHTFVRPIFEHCLTEDPIERCSIAELDNYLETYQLEKSSTFQLQEYVMRFVCK